MILDTFSHAMTITGFVLTMMVLIEYINVQTRGWWQEGLKRSGWKQYAIATGLGAVPGCLGAFTVVSLYAHGALSFGALVGTMIATSGDEAFVMLAMFPGRAALLTLGLMLLGWLVAVLIDRLMPGLAPEIPDGHRLQVHDSDRCRCFPAGQILAQLRRLSFPRGLLLGLFFLFLYGLFSGQFGPPEWSWVKVTMAGSGAFALFVSATVPEHFLEEHLWEHVLKRHLGRIFAWTFGALLVLAVLNRFMDVESWVQGNLWVVLFVASLVGLVPQSGPHLAFVTLYAQGTIPLGILLASSIVQDGHGTLPLLAVSKKAFGLLKLVNLVVGVGIGGLFLLFSS